MLTPKLPHWVYTALLGPSGCGKTTLLRIIAGLEVPDSGAIYFHGENAISRHARERQVGFVFQHYALFRHERVRKCGLWSARQTLGKAAVRAADP